MKGKRTRTSLCWRGKRVWWDYFLEYWRFPRHRRCLPQHNTERARFGSDGGGGGSIQNPPPPLSGWTPSQPWSGGNTDKGFYIVLKNVLFQRDVDSTLWYFCGVVEMKQSHEEICFCFLAYRKCRRQIHQHPSVQQHHKPQLSSFYTWDQREKEEAGLRKSKKRSFRNLAGIVWTWV